MSNIRKSSVVVMVAEADALNWNDASAIAHNGETMYMTRLGARHGQKSSNKNNAYTNFAFFDGHVQLFPTQPIEDTSGGDAAMREASGTIFILHNQ
jgi:prepilin-type processing-associated H-X9-DG protein